MKMKKRIRKQSKKAIGAVKNNYILYGVILVAAIIIASGFSGIEMNFLNPNGQTTTIYQTITLPDGITQTTTQQTTTQQTTTTTNPTTPTYNVETKWVWQLEGSPYYLQVAFYTPMILFADIKMNNQGVWYTLPAVFTKYDVYTILCYADSTTLRFSLGGDQMKDIIVGQSYFFQMYYGDQLGAYVYIDWVQIS